MQMIRITKRLRMRGTRTGSLSAACSRYIKDCKDALKSVYLPLSAVNVSLVVNMPRQKRRKPYQQLTEFVRGRIVGMREGGFSYRKIAARTQCNATTVMRVWKKWTEENQTRRKPGSGARNSTTARDDRHLIRMAVTDRTASSRVLAQRWSTATGVLLSSSTVRRRLLQHELRARVPLRRIPLSLNHRRLRLQWAQQHSAWRAQWQQVVFSDESRYNLEYNDGRVRVRRYRGERLLPQCVIQRHTARTPGIMVWGAIGYNCRSHLVHIAGNLNSDRYIREIVEPEVLPLLRRIPGAVFQQDNARAHVSQTAQAFFSAQQVSLLPWPAYSPDMSPIEHVWDFIGRRLARTAGGAHSKTELWRQVEAIWNAIPQDYIQNLYYSMPRRVQALIAQRGGHTKY